VDVEPEYCNLDPEKIETAITPKTTAILPVHVYGNPCNVKRIQEIADIYGLKVIYDAAHAFGVKINNQSILNFGDLSVLSFHATKVFTTFEGGAIICHDEKTKTRIDYLKNFGFAGETTVIAPGINSKMNEFQAALGLLQIKYFEKEIKKAKHITEIYREKLSDIRGLSFFDDMIDVKHNYAYFPLLINQKDFLRSRDDIYFELKRNNIFARRYFYPLISQFPPYRGLPSSTPENLPVATEIANQILCLPIYPSLNFEEIKKICDLLKN
jgi:dTDP-4-amino-4,6-dideoxygalactose transaminase